MTIENWAQVSISVVSVIAAIITAAATYYFTKKKQFLADETRLKEKAYLEFIDAISNNVLSDDIENSKSRLSETHNKILLIGSSDVVQKLREFAKYIGSDYKGDFSQSGHDQLITELIKSMRFDLYKNKKVNTGYPMIAISRKHRRGEKPHSVT